jgi:hypothetical protein
MRKVERFENKKHAYHASALLPLPVDAITLERRRVWMVSISSDGIPVTDGLERLGGVGELPEAKLSRARTEPESVELESTIEVELYNVVEVVLKGEDDSKEVDGVPSAVESSASPLEEEDDLAKADKRTVKRSGKERR